MTLWRLLRVTAILQPNFALCCSQNLLAWSQRLLIAWRLVCVLVYRSPECELLLWYTFRGVCVVYAYTLNCKLANIQYRHTHIVAFWGVRNLSSSLSLLPSILTHVHNTHTYAHAHSLTHTQLSHALFLRVLWHAYSPGPRKPSRRHCIRDHEETRLECFLLLLYRKSWRVAWNDE